jgi:hypothetical protein
MIKRKNRVSAIEREELLLERRAALLARYETVRSSEDLTKIDRAQRLAELAVVLADFEIEIDQWKNVRAMDGAQERATAAGIHADNVVADVCDV